MGEIDEKTEEIKRLQEELKHRTAVEKAAERLICNREYEVALDLLESLNDRAIKELAGIR